MIQYDAGECVMPVDPSWADSTHWQYQNGPLVVVIARRPKEGDLAAHAQKHLDEMGRGLPRYQLLSREVADRPMPGSVLFVHRYEDEEGPRVEAGAFFEQHGLFVAFLVAAPEEHADDCKEVLRRFVETFRPREPKS